MIKIVFFFLILFAIVFSATESYRAMRKREKRNLYKQLGKSAITTVIVASIVLVVVQVF